MAGESKSRTTGPVMFAGLLSNVFSVLCEWREMTLSGEEGVGTGRHLSPK